MHHHLVVLQPRYLQLMLLGCKRIECRLTQRINHWQRVIAPGDYLWLKPVGQAVEAVAVVGHHLFLPIQSRSDMELLRVNYGDEIMAPEEFYSTVEVVSVACLIWIHSVTRVTPIPIKKSDQRGWVVLDGPPQAGLVISGKRKPLKSRA